MAPSTQTVIIEIYQPDGITLRESYSEVIGIRAKEEIVWQDTLTFEQSAMGGFGDCSFTLWVAESDIDAVEDDVVKIKVDGTYRYIGYIVSRVSDLRSHNLYADKTHFQCRSMLDARAVDIFYRLIETDGGRVLTDIQSIYNDLFAGGEFTGKGQDNNSSITDNSLITYAEGNNTLPVFAINAKYTDTSFLNAFREILSITRGTQDLTTEELYIAYQKGDLSMITKAREDDTTPLLTVTLDSGIPRVYKSDDVEDFNTPIDRAGIINKVIINDTDYSTTGSQYTTEISTSQTNHGIVEWRYESDNITTDKVQEWVDGWILRTLEPITTYNIRLKKLTYAMAPVWFNGGSNVPDGYIKIENVGKAKSTVTAPFQRATYRLTDAGWDIDIIAGELRPVLETTAITSQSPFANSTLSGGVTIFDPSDTADDTTQSVPEFKKYVGFQYAFNDIVYKPELSNVKFIVRNMGSTRWGTGGTIIKTLTSATTPAVEETATDSGVFVVWCYNADNTAPAIPINGQDLYPIGYTTGGNDTIYTVECEITIVAAGVSYVLTTDRKPFKFVSQTRDTLVFDHDDRLPTAETDLVKTWTSGTAKVHFFTDETGDEAPDAGAEGWFITNDNVTWTRMTGDFAGNITGTTNDTFEINEDDTSETVVDLIMTANSGANKGAIRYDYNGGSPTLKFSKDYQAGTPTWTDFTTGATEKITATYSSLVYELKVNSTDGSLTFTKDPGGTPDQLMKLTASGQLSIDDDLLPLVDDSYDLGDASLLWANAYIGNSTYTLDLIFSPDGGTTEYGQLESDATNNQVIPHNIAIGFMDG